MDFKDAIANLILRNEPWYIAGKFPDLSMTQASAAMQRMEVAKIGEVVSSIDFDNRQLTLELTGKYRTKDDKAIKEYRAFYTHDWFPGSQKDVLMLLGAMVDSLQQQIAYKLSRLPSDQPSRDTSTAAKED